MPEPDPEPIEVLAGVIADARGRILLARRTEGRDLAGLWEFPGGKREPDETPEQALVRELREELGIEPEIGPRLITVPHRYPHKRLRLDVRHIDAWTGSPKGLDGQALAWVPAEKPRMLGLRQGQKAHLAISLPQACDQAMQRDGVEPKPPLELRWAASQRIARLRDDPESVDEASLLLAADGARVPTEHRCEGVPHGGARTSPSPVKQAAARRGLTGGS